MRKDLISIMDVLSSNAQGLSLAQIAAKTVFQKRLLNVFLTQLKPITLIGQHFVK